MIKKEFIDYLTDKLKIERKELIEKDLLLQSLLIELINDDQFKNNFVFKGGTCLIKCYLGYYRFSEDLDFSYINQKEFSNKSEKQIRRELSYKINSIMILLKNISNKLGLDFKLDKTNEKYVEFGGSNKFVTFKLWYNSAILNIPSFIKIQINFVETFIYKIKESKAKSLIKQNLSKEIRFLFPEYSNLLNKVSLKTYSEDEILIEKVRAILTRKGIKARDFIDVFLILDKTKLGLVKLQNKILAKTKFMLKYEKYLQNLKTKEEEINKELILGEEQKLLLKPINQGFEKFLEDFKPFLRKLIKILIE